MICNQFISVLMAQQTEYFEIEELVLLKYNTLFLRIKYTKTNSSGDFLLPS
jgi:hypothetical protein